MWSVDSLKVFQSSSGPVSKDVDAKTDNGREREVPTMQSVQLTCYPFLFGA